MTDESIQSVLRGLVPSDIPRFVPSPQGGIGRVCSCYDGDTVTLLCLLGGEPARIALRILGVDAPERRGRGEVETRAASDVRQVVEALVLDKVLHVHVVGVDKYGRMLGDLRLGDGEFLSEYLLRLGIVRAYDGACRRPFSIEELKVISAAAQSALKSNGGDPS